MLSQSDPPTPRAAILSGRGVEQGAVEYHAGPVWGDTEKTSLHGQRTRQKQAAQMPEVVLFSFKV